EGRVIHNQIVSVLWGVADLIRDTFKRGKYQDVILPLTVLRRLDCVLAPTKAKELATQAKDKGKLENLDPQLRTASGLAIYTTSPPAPRTASARREWCSRSTIRAAGRGECSRSPRSTSSRACEGMGISFADRSILGPRSTCSGRRSIPRPGRLVSPTSS